ncbi:MAG TPA: glycoside hydrolase family 2 TIM barrel-domain containing protein [Acidimicrobiia bacterium]|nr:glycoside hydrolase family 2 TIM barrel-domain containing protein [Acidimicrobiia bacterium]
MKESLSTEPFLLGVNYWPRRKAMYWWSDFDAAEVADEFDVVASVGMNVVRLFLLWDDWQPASDIVSTERLRDFGVVCDIAADRDLGLDVTFFTGHMSGPNWSPSWLLDPGAPSHPSPYVRQVVSGGQVVDSPYRNMFHDPTALDAERLMLKTVVEAYRDHDAIWMWNLGNEPDLFAHPRTATEGRAWVREMTGLIHDLDPAHPVTTGLHTASLFNDNGFRVDDVYAESDVAVMHGYPMYVDWARGGLDPDFVPYLCALVTALSGKPCLAEEWGGCTSPDTEESVVWEWTAYGSPRTQFMAGEAVFADYVGEVLPRLVEVGSTGAFLWCFADYAEHLWDRPPCDPDGARHERHFGLVRPDGSLKPHAEVIRRFAETRPTVQEAAKTVTLDVTPDQYYQDPWGHAQRLYDVYLDA